MLAAEILFDSGAVERSLRLVDVRGEPETAELRARRLLHLARVRFRLAPERVAEARQLLAKAAEEAGRAGSSQLLARIELAAALMSPEFREAETHLNRALALGEQTRDPFLITRALLDQGYQRFIRSRFDDALAWLERAREVAQRNGFLLMLERTIGNLGWCYYRLGEAGRALELYSEAERLAERIGDGDNRYRLLNNIGNVHLQRGEFDQAVSYYQRAEQLAARAGNQSWRAMLLNNLAEAALGKSDIAAAERFNEQAIGVKRRLGDRRSLAHSEWNAARILAARGRWAEAESGFRSVARSAAEAGEPVVVWKAHASLAALYRGAGRLADADGEYRAAIGTIDREWARISDSQFKVTFLAYLIGFYQDYVDFLMDQGQPARALEAAAAARARVLAQHLGVSPGSSVDFESLARRRGVVLLSYWLAPKRSFLWAVTGRGAAHFVLPPAREIERVADDYAAAIARRYDPLERDNPSGKRLAEMVLEPVRALVPPGSHVVVVPDGGLHAVNFETLVVDGHFWLEDVTLEVTPSLSVLGVARRRPRHPGGGLLLVGDPVPADPAYPPLPHLKEEIASIERRFPACTVYTRERATPQVFVEAGPRRFPFIHFAAHATANAENPLESAVILSRRGGAYKLYAKDVLDASLNADLVTLSACRSAGGRAYWGEGLVGFAWAFLQAGARNVIGGLWDVDDAAALATMDHLYERLASGAPPAVALREAKLRLLRSGGQLRRPDSWGPFEVFTRALD